jgi:uncharacterized damage-inducible protein DinB
MGKHKLVHRVVARVGFEQAIANLGQRSVRLQCPRMGLECHGTSVEVMYVSRVSLGGRRMNIPETYDYLVRARRNLCAGLQTVPDEVLSRPLLNGDKFHCIKDLLFHVVATEDFWIREEILREQPVRQTIPALKDTQGGPVFGGSALEMLVDYWRLVEQSTLAYLPTLDDRELKRVVTVHDRPGQRFTVDGLLWNMMFHEMRHTSQMTVLLRAQGIKPPALDLYYYLPIAAASA